MGDSYREELKKNQKRIRSSNTSADNRAKAIRKAEVRKQYNRIARATAIAAASGQIRMFP